MDIEVINNSRYLVTHEPEVYMMNYKNNSNISKFNRSGFTLIEVVLVLAIGGLIFLLAFIAFQQVSTNRRDTQRRSDLGRIMAELQNYYADTKKAPVGTIIHSSSDDSDGICAPGGYFFGIPVFIDFNEFSATYLCKDGKFYSPNGKNYTTADATITLAPDKIRYYHKNAFTAPSNRCDGTTPMTDGNYKVEIGLEKGSACRDGK